MARPKVTKATVVPHSLPPELVDIRRRFKQNFDFYARKALKIRTKEGTITPLVLNRAQRILHEAVEKQLKTEGKIRVIILKARQQGLSTYVGGRLYFDVSQREAAKALVVAHKADSTTALFDMTKRYHANVPELLKPHTLYSSRRELTFDLLDSSYTVATAGGDSIARGETITHLHCSELAFWPRTSAAENWNGLRQAVPETKGTAIFIESTANGVSGLYYDLWQGAVTGTNGYIPVFIPWYLDEGYRLKPPADFSLTPEETELAQRFSLDNSQLAWRRRKIAETGIDLFKQEYPATPDEAFLTSGRPVFIPEQVNGLLMEAPLPIARLALEGSEWLPHPKGELTMYAEVDPKETYVIGADVGGGVRGDFSVAQVMNSRREQVALWRGQVVPDFYANVLYRLGIFFNWAMVAIESNNHGILPNHILAKELHYPHVWQDTQYDKTTDKETPKLGFFTSVRTKPLIIDKLRGRMRKKEITVLDKTTLREMLTFIVTESGAMEAEEGCHDDCVISLALANHISDEAYKPVKCKRSWYVPSLS